MAKKRTHTVRSTAGYQKTTKNKPAIQSWVWGLAALVLVLAVGGVYWLTAGQNAVAGGLSAEISVDEAYQKYNEGAFILDVRTPEEWVEYHAPNTTLIPLNELPNRLAEIPQDQEIVVVCRSGNRSQEGRDILLNAGFKAVSSMAGGLNAWRTAGYPVVSGQ